MIIFIMAFITVLLFLVTFAAGRSYKFENISIISFVLGVFAAMTTFIMIIVAIAIHTPINRKQKLTEYEQTYSAISQMINNNDNAVITLTSQIAEYNANVLKGRIMQDSKMLSVFEYDFYYDLPLIELDNGVEK